MSNRKSPWTSVAPLSSAGKFLANQSDSSLMAGMSLVAAALYCFVQVDTFYNKTPLKVLNISFTVPCPNLPVSCSSLIPFQILQGSGMPGPASVVSPELPLQPHTEPLSLPRSPQGDADPERYAPVRTREFKANCFLSSMPMFSYMELTC